MIVPKCAGTPILVPLWKNMYLAKLYEFRFFRGSWMIMLATSFNNPSIRLPRQVEFHSKKYHPTWTTRLLFSTHGHSVIQTETPSTISLCSPSVSPGHSVSVPRTSASERHPAAWSERRRRVPKSWTTRCQRRRLASGCSSPPKPGCGIKMAGLPEYCGFAVVEKVQNIHCTRYIESTWKQKVQYVMVTCCTVHQGRLYPTISHHLITGETNRQELIALVGFQTRREILGTNSTPSFIAPLTNMFKNLHRLITYPILLALFWRQLGPAGQKNMFLPSVVETFTFNKYMNRRRTKKNKKWPPLTRMIIPCSMVYGVFPVGGPTWMIVENETWSGAGAYPFAI